MTIKEITEKLASLRAEINQKGVLQTKQRELRNELDESKIKHQELMQQLVKEKKDVDRLNSLSFASLAAAITKTKPDRLDKEERELLDAKIKMDRFNTYQKDLQKSIRDVTLRLSKIKQLETYYEDYVKQKKELILNSSTQEGERLHQLMNDYEYLTSQKKELDEAYTSGKFAVKMLEDAIKNLRSAKRWGVYDALGAHGIITHILKYEKISDAQHSLAGAQMQIKHFIREAKEVDFKPLYHGLHLTTTDIIIDSAFDNIFTDLSVLNKLNISRENAKVNLDKVSIALNTIKESRNKVNEKLKNLKTEMNAILNKKTA